MNISAEILPRKDRKISLLVVDQSMKNDTKVKILEMTSIIMQLT